MVNTTNTILQTLRQNHLKVGRASGATAVSAVEKRRESKQRKQGLYVRHYHLCNYCNRR